MNKIECLSWKGEVIDITEAVKFFSKISPENFPDCSNWCFPIYSNFPHCPFNCTKATKKFEDGGCFKNLYAILEYNSKEDYFQDFKNINNLNTSINCHDLKNFKKLMRKLLEVFNIDEDDVLSIE